MLFKDNTFLTYGIYDNKQENDIYICMVCKWHIQGRKRQINPSFLKDITNSAQLIKDIKNASKLRKDYALINNYLEFVWEKYKDYSIAVIKNKLFDEKKKYEYRKIN